MPKEIKQIQFNGNQKITIFKDKTYQVEFVSWKVTLPTTNLLIDAKMARFYDELVYGNRQSITGTDFNVLFDDTYGTWTATDAWDTLNEGHWDKCIWKDASYEITIENLDGVDITEARIGIGNVSRTGSGTQSITISYTPISTGIQTDIWVIDTNHETVVNYVDDLLKLLENAGLSTTIQVGDKIKFTNTNTAHNHFVLGVKAIV